MDKVKITPCPLSGRIKIPPSKSYAHRAIISAFLSGESCKINNIVLSEDILATLDCINALGGSFAYDENNSTISIDKNRKALPEKIRLDCRESGSTLRFFIPIALCFSSNLEFFGEGRLMSRPLTPYLEIFDKLGIQYSQTDQSLIVQGSLKPGDFVIDGSVSSQFITGLLFALPLLDADSRIIIMNELSSKAYVDITLDVMKSFGINIENNSYNTFVIKGRQKYKSQSYTVEGDFSQAAFFLVAGALGCDIICDGLSQESLQGDKKILEILRETGAEILQLGDTSFKAQSTPNMHGITVDADNTPDLVPILAVLFAFCQGESRIINAHRLRLKESDRLAAICDVLKKMGADIKEGENFLIIQGKQSLYGAEVSTHNDHRIVMATAIAACRCKGLVNIGGAMKAVKKSYPDFFEDYKRLGGKAE